MIYFFFQNNSVRVSLYQLLCSSFTLTSNNAREYRKNLFTQIHQIVFYGKGGYDFDTVYNLPLWLRNYTYSEIQKHYEEENKAASSSNTPGTSTLVSADGTIQREQFKAAQPNFTKRTPRYK